MELILFTKIVILIMIEVQLKPYLLDFQLKFKDAILNHSLFGIQDFQDLQDNFEIIIASLSKSEEYYIEIEEHRIDKFGLGQHAVNFANSGSSLKDTATALSIISGQTISIEELKYWYENYSTIARAKKVKTYGNIFNIQERMQTIFEELQDHLEEIRVTNKEDFFKGKTTREQVIIDVLKDVRTLTKDAKEILKTVNQQQKLEEFKYLVIETIRTIDPGTAQIIIQKLEQDQALFNALLPPG